MVAERESNNFDKDWLSPSSVDDYYQSAGSNQYSHETRYQDRNGVVRQRLKLLLLLLFFLFLLLAIGLGVGVPLSRRSKNPDDNDESKKIKASTSSPIASSVPTSPAIKTTSPSNVPTYLPTKSLSPTEYPTTSIQLPLPTMEQAISALEIFLGEGFLDLGGDNYTQILRNEATPQYKALQWLTTIDLMTRLPTLQMEIQQPSPPGDDEEDLPMNNNNNRKKTISSRSISAAVTLLTLKLSPTHSWIDTSLPCCIMLWMGRIGFYNISSSCPMFLFVNGTLQLGEAVGFLPMVSIVSIPAIRLLSMATMTTTMTASSHRCLLQALLAFPLTASITQTVGRSNLDSQVFNRFGMIPSLSMIPMSKH